MSDTALPQAPDGLFTLIKTATRALVLACAAPGQTGPQRVEQMTGYSAGMISRWQGDNYRDLMPLDVVFQIESALGKPIFSRMLASLTGHELNPVAQAGEGRFDLMGAVIRTTGSHSRFAAQAAEALEDQKVTPGEAKALLKSILKHQEDMGEIARRLAALAEVG
ncbi:MAG: hypothetical protein K2X84_15930 [Beijerinckiaceae bacterium]|nr:hypothetical protein [Beijerinckiaceae bacterium]